MNPTKPLAWRTSSALFFYLRLNCVEQAIAQPGELEQLNHCKKRCGEIGLNRVLD